jgi:ferredoxin--NADP+ reductase
MAHMQTVPRPPRIAIVGTGPSGCYTAQFLLKRWPDAEITMFDRLGTPYGLIRYGVAPDHLGTKAIAKQFARLFESSRVTFIGDVEVGRDVALDDLRRTNDAVVMATGLWADRTIDGFHDLAGRPTRDGVYGAGRLTRMINGYPGADASDVALGRRTVIVGNGNVAADLVRLVLTPAGMLRDLDVPEDAIRALQRGPIERIDVVGRSAAERAKFDVAMLKELAGLPDVRFAHDEDLVGASPVADAVRALAAGSPRSAAREVRFHFGWSPERLEGDGRVSAAVFQATTDAGRHLELATDSVCTAVGFTEAADDVVLRSALESGSADVERGFLADGLYCVGWLRRGPVGTIPANRADARLVADSVIADVEAALSSSAFPSASVKEHA